MKKNINPDLPYLEAKLRQSGHYFEKASLTQEMLNEIPIKKFEKINWEMAKKDIRPFIKDLSHLHLGQQNILPVYYRKIRSKN